MKTTTAQKRQYFLDTKPKQLSSIYDYVDSEHFRLLDMDAQKENNVQRLQYTITLLCDELVRLTNDNNTD